MTDIITTNLKYTAAVTFINSVGESNNSLYLFIGRQLPWPNDVSPPQPVASNKHYKDIWDNMQAALLVTLNNTSLVVPNITWTSNTTYSAYSDQIDMSTTSSFYVMNTSNEVYKCLSNNNGILSTVMPAGLGSNSSNYIQTLSDGYQWKYMLNVDPSNLFLNSQWIPIPIIAPPNSFQASMQTSAIPGAISTINVVSSGLGYVNNPQSYILNIVGDGVNANGYANVVSGMIQNIVMVDYGQNYTYATVTLTDPSGSGAVLQPVMSPYGGHGSNASLELGAKSVMISLQIANSENGLITTTNSFRQSGLLLNPYQLGTQTLTSNTTLQTSTYITVSGGFGTFINNEQVYQGLNINSSIFSGYVIDYNSTPNLLRLNNVTGQIQEGTVLFGANSGAQRYIISTTYPTVQKYTGLILDYNNYSPIQRQLTQTELFQFVETFG